MESIENEVQAICDAASGDKDIAIAAMQNERRAMMANASDSFTEAVRHGRVAGLLWDRLAVSETASDSQRSVSKLSALGTAVCLGSSQWKSGDFIAARQTFDNAKSSLAGMREEMEAPRKPKGFFRFLKSAKPDFDLLRQWTQTYAAVDMNKGVMLHAQDKFEEALQSYSLAEQTLFDGYVKQVGPDEDTESTGKVVNLWENIMACALDANETDRAAEATSNTMRLISYWPAHGHDIPEQVAEATGVFLGRISDLPPESRSKLDAALPEGLADSINSLMAE